MPKVEEHEVREIRELKADGRGRVTLGPDYQDRRVRVAVLEPEPRKFDIDSVDRRSEWLSAVRRLLDQFVERIEEKPNIQLTHSAIKQYLDQEVRRELDQFDAGGEGYGESDAHETSERGKRSTRAQDNPAESAAGLESPGDEDGLDEEQCPSCTGTVCQEGDVCGDAAENSEKSATGDED